MDSRPRDAESGDAVGLALPLQGPRLLDSAHCIECFIHNRVKIARDEGARRRLLELLRKAVYRTELFVEGYRIATGGADLYRESRARLNEAVLRIVKRVYEECRDVEQWLTALAAANMVDVNMPWHRFSTEMLLSELSRLSMRVRVPREVVRLVEGSRSIALLLDNAGEAVVDIAFAIYAAESGRRIYLVARSEPYEVDVTVEEAQELLERVAEALGIDVGYGVRIVETGSSYPAPAYPHVGNECIEVLKRVDVVISKGIANAEAIIEYGALDSSRVVLVLRAKCPPIAKLFGVEMGSPIVAAGCPRPF